MALNVLYITEMYPVNEDFTFGVFVKKQIDALLPKLSRADILFPITMLRSSRLYHALRGRPYLPLEFADTGSDKKKLSFVPYPVLRGTKTFMVERALAGSPIRYDLIHAHGLTDAGIIAARLGKKLGIPSVITVCGTDVNQFRNGGGHPLQRTEAAQALQDCTAVIAKSNYLRTSALELGCPEEKIRTIPNLTDSSVFRPLDRTTCYARTGRDPNRKYFLYIGTYAEVKGINYLLSAFRDGHFQTDHDLLIVGGSGELDALVKEHARNCPAIKELGFLKPEEVAPYINCAEAVIQPSLSEGLPNVAIETISCGRPMIATEVGGTPEVITHGVNGLLIPPRDEQALIKALSTLPKISWDTAAITASAGRFQKDTVVQDIVAVYEDCLNGA